jgi:glucosamine-6-phosphate deaminase
MLVLIRDDYDAMSKEAALQVAHLIRRKPDCVIGFATGSSPLGLYKELIRMHQNEGLDFSKLVSFNLDEYIGLPPTHDQSYHYFMWENLFKHVNINPTNVHIPMGMAEDIEAFCDWYEERIESFGGIDLQILGVGGNGHIAFNEPGSSLGSRTRIKTLTVKTREDNARFFDSMEDVPRFAITMGVGTIMEARKLVLVANGPGKADAVHAMVEGPITARVPASVIQMHQYATLVLDKAAASKLENEYVE